MTTYETTARVEEQGQVHLAGVPFPLGTQVQVTISVSAACGNGATASQDEDLQAARERMTELFARIKGFRNSPRIPREELYDRGSLRCHKRPALFDR